MVHAENNQAKFLIAANKMRINILRKNLAAIDKERKLNVQKRIRINRKPYITDSKGKVQGPKSEKTKDSSTTKIPLDSLNASSHISKAKTENEVIRYLKHP